LPREKEETANLRIGGTAKENIMGRGVSEFREKAKEEMRGGEGGFPINGKTGVMNWEGFQD